MKALKAAANKDKAVEDFRERAQHFDIAVFEELTKQLFESKRPKDIPL